MRLVRLLYERGYTREHVLELFRVLDWMLRLPEDLEHEFKRELITFEEQAKMPYVTGIERLSRQEGRKEGRQQGEARVFLRLITLKFGPPAKRCVSRSRPPTPRPCCGGPSAFSPPRPLTKCSNSPDHLIGSG